MNLGIALDGADVVLHYLVWCYFATKMLPMARPGLFWLVEALLNAVVTGCGYLYTFLLPDAQAPLAAAAFVAMLLGSVVVPLVFWEGGMLRRIVAVCAWNLCDGVSSGVMYVMAEPLLGAPLSGHFPDELAQWGSHPLAWVACELVMQILFIGLLALACRLVRRGRQSAAVATGPLILLLLGQLMLCFLCSLALIRPLDPLWYGIMAALFVVSGVVVAAGVVAADRCAALEEARWRRLLDESRRAGYFADQEKSQAIVRSIAVLRHDMRNELAAARHLAERGQVQRARDILWEMADRCDRADDLREEAGKR